MYTNTIHLPWCADAQLDHPDDSTVPVEFEIWEESEKCWTAATYLTNVREAVFYNLSSEHTFSVG
jgi:hypothetical protein